MVTIKEIAEKSGVSIGTVDRVLHARGRASEATRRKVLAVAAELGYAPNQAAQGLAVRKRKLHLGFVIVNPDGHPFFRKVFEAARAKAEALAVYGVRVSFFVIQVARDAGGNPQARIDMPEGVRLEDLDGIVLPGIDGVAREGGFSPLFSLKIPAVFYNNPPEAPRGLAYVGCDYEKAGAIAAGLCALCTGGRGRVAIVSENAGDIRVDAHSERVRGFEARLRARYPEMSIEARLGFTNDYEADLEAARAFLAKHPGLDVVYVVNPGDYGICRAIRAADRAGKIRIITNDLVDGVEQLMREGVIAATVCQEPEAQGELPLQLLFEYLAYGKEPEQFFCHTRLSIHLAENAE